MPQADPPTPPLTLKPRELEVLQLLAEGLTDKEIAARLHLGHETVRWYNKQLFEKLGATNRTHAVKRAEELGLLAQVAATSSPSSPPSIPTPARPAVHYVANGDVNIAYQVIGSGPVDLLFIHGFLSHLEVGWQNPDFANFFEQMGRFARVILFDKRGMGLSDRIQGAPSLENTIEDATCVLNAAGSQRAFIMGTSEGGAAAVLLASTYPERVLGLILYASTAKVVRTRDEPAWAITEEGFDHTIEQMQKSWGGPWAVESFAPSCANDDWFRDWWAMVLRSASSPSSVKAVLTTTRQVDIRPLLPQVRVKTLVVHKTGDKICSVDAGHYLANHMPNAAWVELPGADHIYFVKSEALLSAVESFCKEASFDAPVDTSLSVILLCAPTQAGQPLPELGDAGAIQRYNPRHLALTASGTLALFDSPTRAIQCALRLRETARPGSVKISLHVGECNVLTGKPLAPVMEAAQRAAAQVPAGQIGITQTLRAILAGLDLVFDEGQRSSDRLVDILI
jgi:pimeloyl-ACP methyl ester carboxylesterase/DNA-binding CsgD family transcriptional regulator